MLMVNRWNPFDELMSFHRDVERVLDRYRGGETDRTVTRGWAPQVEVVSDQGEWKVRAALPGVDPRNVRIDLQGNTLRIAGDREAQTGGDGAAVHSELAYGAFERTFTLPSAIDRDRVRASWHQGMLEIILPVAESEKPRRIEITGAELRDIDVKKLA